jgi:membrane peptidoglycan carboxypeptidase
MGRSDDPFWSRPASPSAGGPDDFFGEPLPPPGYDNADSGFDAPGSPPGSPPPRDPRAPYDDDPYADPYGGYDDPYAPDPGLGAEREPVGVGGRSGRTPSGERKSPRGHSKRNLLWRWRRGFFVIGLVVMAMIAGGVAMVAQAELPEDPVLQQASFYCPAAVTENCNAQNAMVRVSSDEDRVLVTLDQVPEILVHAVVAAEDREFFTHKGVDPMGIGRALYHDLQGGGLQGGSTITQQLVKNSYLGSERTLTRKLREAMLSIKIEQSMSKNEILERYFNTIYFGRNAYGVQAASRVYFNKDVAELGLPEASYLAGLIRAPSLADPFKDLEEATRRRQTVLDAMLEEGYINQDEHDLTEAMKLDGYVVQPESYRLNKVLQAPGKGMEYVTEYIKRQLESDAIGLTDDDLALGGLRVYTTIDPDMQTKAWNAIYDPNTTDTPLNRPELPEGSLVAIDDQGHVKAMVGGRDPNGQGTFFAVRGMGSNGRPVGSTFKPIALAQAMQDNYSLSADLPAPAKAEVQQSIEGCAELWEPGNYNDSEYATQTLDLVAATRVSSNTAYANLMYALSENGTSTQKVRDMAVRLGMSEDELSNCMPLVLGTANSTPLEMAEIYSTFANQGRHKEPTVITRVERVDQDGSVKVLYTAQPDEGTPVITADQANKVTYALQQVVQGDGTGHDARLDGIPCAGKTGTTQSNKDAWFVGYTPKLTAAVWMGYPLPDWTDPEKFDTATNQFRINEETGERYTKEIPPMTQSARPVYDYSSITGGTMPAKIWHTFMQSVITEPTDFVPITEEQLRDGRPFEGGTFQSTPETTVGTTPPETPPSTPPTSAPPVTPPTSSTSIPDTSVPDTSVPDTTTTTLVGPPFTRPGGGGGGGGQGSG